MEGVSDSCLGVFLFVVHKAACDCGFRKIFFVVATDGTPLRLLFNINLCSRPDYVSVLISSLFSLQFRVSEGNRKPG